MAPNLLYFLYIILFITLFGLPVMVFRSRVKPVSKVRIIMGTFIEITAYGRNASSAIDAAFKRIHEIEAQSGRDKTSDISKLNAAAGGTAIQVREDTWQMMALAKEYWKKTEKAFDVTAGPLVDLWGFGYDGRGRVPEPGEVDAAMLNVGSEKLMLDPVTRSIRLAKAGMAVTVGGIAKGYAVEEAVAVLKAEGIKRALVNGGGSSIKVIGSGHPNHRWRIGIENPRRPGEIIGTITLKSGQALGTSAEGCHFVIKDGCRYSHLIDPRTGYPSTSKNAQVSIITNNAAESEMLTKALFLNDRAWSRRFLKDHAYQAIIVDTEGRVYTTNELKLKEYPAAGSLYDSFGINSLD